MSVRFAPSPTGKFHIGNLRTAWISHWWAKHLKSSWVVRFEDIDAPRVIPGAVEEQLETLAQLSLIPDAVYLQSERRSRHWALLQTARELGQVYPCYCSRREIGEALSELASAPHEAGPIYSGKCRSLSRPVPARALVGWRFKGDDPSGKKDFLVARSSPPGERGNISLSTFVPAYPWACAIDDLDGRYGLLVRAFDLAPARFFQRAIQKWILSVESAEISLPEIFHCSLITQDDGHRLEKRTRGVTLSELLASGFSVSNLIEKFEVSFSPAKKPISFETEWGETRAQLAVSQLLTTP